MEVAVWDTYAKSSAGHFLHFDIIVPAEMRDTSCVYQYGKQYLDSINEDVTEINPETCQFCHIEEPAEEIASSIQQRGYYILRMEDIPPALPENPNRREMILHLRAYFPIYRFVNFKGLSEGEVSKMLKDAKKSAE
jgi:hypothetical protein